MTNGFRQGTRPGRIGSYGTYVNNTPEGAFAEFKFHHPGITPKILEVEYNPGINANSAKPPRKYVMKHPLNVDSISSPSTRAPGTINTNVLNGSAKARRLLP